MERYRSGVHRHREPVVHRASREFAPLAAVERRVDPEAVQTALQEWFTAVLYTGALTFAIGIACLAIAILRDRALDPKLAWVVVVALIVMAASRIVPFAAIQFYVQSAAALIALWPLAWVMSTAAPSDGETEGA
jgi:uncharacterized membrane protein YjjP (DUF1212 family)